MLQRGRKKGCSDEIAANLRQKLYEAYDMLQASEKAEDATRAQYLTRSYYVDKLFDMHIASWSKSRIRRLLMYRYRDDR